ncbi:hypothetical protein [Arthrobacter sp.]|uniref:hypothetical protein n=1 Tax=Arthrobacter sp. TaxID=1667 RepID=UPI00339B8A4E
MAAHPKQRTHSGEGHLVSNLITFVVIMLIFFGSLYAFSLESVIGPIPAFAIGLGLFTLAFFIPKQIIGRSDTHHKA